MRIAFVTHQFFPTYYTGVERITLNLARQLGLMGHECVVVTPADRSSGGTAPYAVEGVRVRPAVVARAELERPWLTAPRDGGDLARILREEGSELVHLMHPMRFPHAFGVAGGGGLPVVAHVPDFAYLCARVNMLRLDGTRCPSAEDGRACSDVCRIRPAQRRLAWGRGVLARASAVVCPSRATIALHEAEGFDTSGWHRVPWGVDYALHPSRLPPPAGEGLTIGFLGTLQAHKGPHVLVEALRRLPGRDVVLEVYGGSFHEDAYARDLQALAAGDERIRFRGAYDHRELPAILAALDALAIPSVWHENVPTTGLNAIASGVPLLVSDVAGLREVVDDYDCGLTFPTGEAEAFADLIERLLAEPSLLRDLRRRMSYPPSIEEEAWRIATLYGDARRPVAGRDPTPRRRNS
jgi:glycosyltransferase involved in cell wall biosynthesis